MIIRWPLVLVFFCMTVISQAQRTEMLYDLHWQPASFANARYASVTVKTDSGWLRHDYYLPKRSLQMKGLYKDSACLFKHGQFYYLYDDGKPELIGNYSDNKKDGLWLGYHPNGMIRDSTHYDSGEIVGASVQWYSSGFISDSTNYGANGAVQISWYEDGKPSAAGRLNYLNMPTGKWKYYHPNGQVSAEELFEMGRLKDKIYYTEEGLPLSDTTDRTRAAQFKGGVSRWTDYLGSHLFWPTGYSLANTDRVEIGVKFRIDENGLVKDVYLFAPFESIFNDIVLRVIRNSPKWEPAIAHNRRVSYQHAQTITFTMNPPN